MRNDKLFGMTGGCDEEGRTGGDAEYVNYQVLLYPEHDGNFTVIEGIEAEGEDFKCSFWQIPRDLWEGGTESKDGYNNSGEEPEMR